MLTNRNKTSYLLSRLSNPKRLPVNLPDVLLGSTQNRSAFSLVETIAVLVITAMVMLACLTIYSRVKDASAAVNTALNRDGLATEILQRIAEDLDRMAFPGMGITIAVHNKFDSSGYSMARLIIQNVVYGGNDRQKIFERIIWQSYYDYFTDSLILYRSHNGVNLEDKVITDDAQVEMKQENKDFFIPLCTGITFFKIQVPQIKVFGENAVPTELEDFVEVPEEEEKFLDGWGGNEMPKAITVSISFAEPYQAVTGELDVPESEKITRTIAIDRTRKMKYRFVARDLEPIDPNDLLDEGSGEAGTDELPGVKEEGERGGRREER